MEQSSYGLNQKPEYSLFSEKFVNFLLIDGKKIKAYNIYFENVTIIKI